MHLDATALVKLSLVDIPYESVGRLLLLAADCPQLEVLHLERIRRREPLPGAPVLLLAPWLSLDIRTLGIVNCDEEMWMQLMAIPTFRLPKLISFALEHREGNGPIAHWGTTPEMLRAFVSHFSPLGHPLLRCICLSLTRELIYQPLSRQMSASPYLENVSLVVNSEDLSPRPLNRAWLELEAAESNRDEPTFRVRRGRQ